MNRRARKRNGPGARSTGAGLGETESLPLTFACLLLLGSGFCSLTYETVWLREFRLFFGASTSATAAVLGIYLTSLGSGAICLGAYRRKGWGSVKLYAALELLAALSASLFPLLLTAARHVYILAGGTGSLGMIFGNILRLLLGAVVIGLPCFFAGGALPVIVRGTTGSGEKDRQVSGLLYGVNALGGAIAVALATFYFLETAGNHATYWMAVLLNFAVAGGAALLAARSRTARASHDDDTRTNQRPEDAPSIEHSDDFTLGHLLYAGASGFVFLLMELVWYRMLAPLLGGTTYSFGLILFFVLLGIAAGSAFYNRLGPRRSDWMQLAMISGFAAAALAAPYALGDRVAVTAMFLRAFGGVGFAGSVLGWAVVCAIVVLPGSFASGAQFAAVLAAAGGDAENSARRFGQLYGCNMAGSLLGSIFGGFAALPMFSAIGAWKGAVLLLCVVSWAALGHARNQLRASSAIFAVIFSAAGVLTLFAEGPTSFWRHNPIGAGRSDHLDLSINELRDQIQFTRRKILWEKDGVESSVAVENWAGVGFLLNGKVDGNARLDAGTQMGLGLLGTFLHPKPERALVVGLGTGTSAGWLAKVPTMQSVECVELEPAVLHVAEACSAVNEQVLENPKVHITIGDAREYLLSSRNKFDIIASEPSNPYRAGISGLFTREFYTVVEQHLQPGGVFVQWLQGYDVDNESVQDVYATLTQLFPKVYTWCPQGNDLLLFCARDSLDLPVSELRRRLAGEPYATAFAHAWQVFDLEGVLAHFVAGPRTALALTQEPGATVCSDDRNVLEWSFAKGVSHHANFNKYELIQAARRLGDARWPEGSTEVDWTSVTEQAITLSTLYGHDAPTGEKETDLTAAISNYSAGHYREAYRFWSARPRTPRNLSELALVAMYHADSGTEDAPRFIEQMRTRSPSEAAIVRAHYLLRRKDPGAMDSLASALTMLRTDPWPSLDLLYHVIALGREASAADASGAAARKLYEPFSKPFAVYVVEEERKRALVEIARAMEQPAYGPNTAAALHQYEPWVPWNAVLLGLRSDCYTKLGDPLATRAHLEFLEYQKHAPHPLFPPQSPVPSTP